MSPNPHLLIHLKSGKNISLKKGMRGTPSLQNKVSKPIEIVETENQQNPWDQAHEVIREDLSKDIDFVEPDVSWDDPELLDAMRQEQEARGDNAPGAEFKYIEYWPAPAKPMIWHLADTHSGLLSARRQVKESADIKYKTGIKPTIRIAHLDTGYMSAHIVFPKSLINQSLQRNFAPGEEEEEMSAEDPFKTGLGRNPGHGLGTGSILAGAKVKIPELEFEDTIGLADYIEIVPIRIASGVILLKSRSFVRAMDYIINELNQKEETRVHVISMSMGGLPTKAWAEMVNKAYEQGVIIVTAAGNNFGKLPVKTLIYPARFARVIGVCGVTYDRTPYAKPKGEGNVLKIMEGNHGPRRIMNTVVSAFTPNVCWASFKNKDRITIRGDGTSSATPQVAAAVAIYYIKNYDELTKLPDGWMRVEAIRHALFASADKSIAAPYKQSDIELYYGNGILQAHKMMDIEVKMPALSQKQKPDKASFPFLRIVFGKRAGMQKQEDEMMETEIMQLIMEDKALQDFLEEEEKELKNFSKDDQILFAQLVIGNPKASSRLKKEMERTIIKNQA